MSSKKKFLLRIDPKLYDILEGWAADELRSVNTHIEFLLREAAKRSGRLSTKAVQQIESAREDNQEEED